MSDDYTSDIQTTGAVAVGGSATGELETAGDHDWFAVTLEADRTYRIDLEGSRTRAGTLRDPFLRGIYDEHGTIIAGTANDDGGLGLNSQVTFTAPADGTYYVAAGAYSRTGTYTLSVTDITVEITDDYTSDTQTTGTVAVGGSARGAIETADDVDWFAVTLKADTTYQIDLKGLSFGSGTLRDPFLHGIHTENGDLIPGTTNDDGRGWDSRVTFTPLAGGTYYVAAGAWGGFTGTYSLSVTNVTDDFAAGTETSGTVTVGGSARGTLEVVGDVDWFAVTLAAGTTYQIDLKGSWTGDGTLRDPFLHGIYNERGTRISNTWNDDGGAVLNSRVKFKPEADGTYYVAAGSWQGGAGAHLLGRGTYLLSVTEVTDDFAAGTETTGTVAVGGLARGELETVGDVDWFAVTLKAEGIYNIDLRGRSTGDGSLYDPRLRGIYDADGDLIAGTTNDNGGVGFNSRLTFKPDEDGTYYVAAGPTFWSPAEGTGTYTLSVIDVTDAIAQDDFAAGTETTGAVAVGGSATGDISYLRDRDWFTVTLEADRTYRIDLEGESTGRGTLIDPFLYGVHDATGAFIIGSTDDDEGAGRNSEVIFRSAVGGTFYVAAGAWRDLTGTYTLSVTDVTADNPDDYPANTQTTGTVAVDGSATGNIETANDHDWFAVNLEANTRYRIDLVGNTLQDTYLRGIHDADGVFIPGTTDDDSRDGNYNSRVWFTPADGGTYYVAAGAYGEATGTYTLSVDAM